MRFVRDALRCAALTLPALAGSAQAQLGGSIVVASDERFRGISLSGEQPTARATLSYDGAGGGYAGLSLAALRIQPDPRRPVWLAFAGRGGAVGSTLRWDAGATYTHWNGDDSYDYGEAYLGIGSERWSLRLNYAPDYFGRGKATLYAEAEGRLPLAPSWRLVGHGGALRRADGGAPTRLDARLGIVLRAADLDWQLAGVTATRSGPYALPWQQHASRLVGSVAWAF